MDTFGASASPITQTTGTFGEYRYVCDTERMISSIIETHTEMMTRTARYPCTLHIHPTDYQHLRQNKLFCTAYDPDDGATVWFMSMRVTPDAAVHRGSAELSICPGCTSMFGICVNRTQR